MNLSFGMGNSVVNTTYYVFLSQTWYFNLYIIDVGL